MYYYRLPCVSVGLIIYLQTSFSRNCDLDFNNVPSKTYQADFVFEARVHRLPSSGGGKGSKEKSIVRFRVSEVYKGTLDKEANTDRYRTISVGWFGLKGDAGHCIAPVPQLGSRYVLFLRSAETDSGIRTTMTTTTRGESDVPSPDFVISGFPEPFSDDVISAVRRSADNKFARKPKVRMPIKNLTFELGKLVRVQCIVSGRPRPEVSWFKDGVRLQNSKRISFQDTKRGSTLAIRRLSPTDFGTYKCQAANAVGSTSLKSTKGVFVSVASPTTEAPVTKPHADRCDVDGYCLHGGKCYVIRSLDQIFCECTSEYTGLRCQEKRTGFTDAYLVLGRGASRKRRLFPTPYAM